MKSALTRPGQELSLANGGSSVVQTRKGQVGIAQPGMVHRRLVRLAMLALDIMNQAEMNTLPGPEKLTQPVRLAA